MFVIISKRRYERMQESIREQSDAKRAAGACFDEVMEEKTALEKAVEVLRAENKMLRSACQGMERTREAALRRAVEAEKENKMMSAALDAIAAADNKALLAVGFEALVKEGLA